MKVVVAMNQKRNHIQRFKADQEKNYRKMLVSSGFTSKLLKMYTYKRIP